MARKKWQILMVDNDADYVASQRPFFENRLGRVLWAKSTAQAEKILAAEKIDLVLLEIMLDEPDSGLRWARKIHKSRSDRTAPIFILSAADERFGLDLKNRINEPSYCPARAFIDKATQPAEILDHLEKFLRSRS